MWMKIAAAVITALVIVAGGYVYLITRIEHEILVAIEQNGTAATTTKVAAKSVGLSLLDGECIIDGLTIDNPPGFTTPYAIALGKITVHAEFLSYFSRGPLLVDKVTIDRPHMFFEIKAGLLDLSLKSLNIAANSNLGTLAQDAKASPGPAPGTPIRREIIKELVVQNGRVTVATSLLKAHIVTEHLAPIRLTDIGQAEGGVGTGRVSAQVLGAIAAQAELQAAGALVKALGNAATGTIGKALDTVKSLF